VSVFLLSKVVSEWTSRCCGRTMVGRTRDARGHPFLSIWLSVQQRQAIALGALNFGFVAALPLVLRSNDERGAPVTHVRPAARISFFSV